MPFSVNRTTPIVICLTAGVLCAALSSPYAYSADDASTPGITASLENNGDYSGSIDPLTVAHEKIIRNAVKDYNLNTLYVLVNADGKKNFKSSVEERLQMLNLALADLSDRIKILPVTQEKRNAALKELSKSTQGPSFALLERTRFNVSRRTPILTSPASSGSSSEGPGK